MLKFENKNLQLFINFKNVLNELLKISFKLLGPVAALYIMMLEIGLF